MLDAGLADPGLTVSLTSLTWPVLAAYLATGAFAGFYGGLLGVGGGAVMVPVLAMLFAFQGFSPNHLMHLALGTSMATIIFTSLSSLRAHHAHGAVRWPVVRAMSPGVLLGTLAGTQLATLFSSRALSVFFILLTAAVAIQMLSGYRPAAQRELPSPLGMVGAGMVLGTVASFAAIGGGALTVPFLIWCQVRAHDAIGTSAAMGLPVALGGSLGYVLQGQGVDGLPAGSLGFVYLPALAALLLASTLAAPVGARVAHRLPVAVLKRLFAGLMLVLSAKLAWSLDF